MSEPVHKCANTGEAATLRRVLGPFDAMCIVIGAIIGVGIFFTPSHVARLAGSADMAMLAWAIGGLIALCGALTFAELGVRFPNAGGQYEILREAYGSLTGFVFVFCNATAIQSGAISVIALLAAQNLAIVATGKGLSSAPAVGLAVILIAGVTVANVLGVRWGAGIQNLTVAAKLMTLVGVTVIALAWGPDGGVPAEVVAGPSAGWPAILFAAIVPSFFAYGGWQHALWMAGEVRAPRRNLPLGIVGGIAIVVAVYLLVNWAYLRLLGYDGVAQSEALASDAVASVWPNYGRRLTAAAVGLSAFGVLNAQLLSGPRLIFRMAADGQFFRAFARVHPRRATPLAAVVLLSGLGLAMLVLAAVVSTNVIDAIDRLTTGVVFVDGIFFALTGAALFVHRARDPRLRGEGAPSVRLRIGYPLIPALFVAGEIGIVLGAGVGTGMGNAVIAGLLWIGAAVVLYLIGFAVRKSS
jgi:APA family basic amino acid/polyamine antiporter